MTFALFLQKLVSFLLLLLGIALIVVFVCNHFIAPVSPLMQDPNKGSLIYVLRGLAAVIVTLTGLFGMASGRRGVHLMLAFASVAIGAGLYFVCEWYIAAAVGGLALLSAFFNFVLSFQKKKEGEPETVE